MTTVIDRVVVSVTPPPLAVIVTVVVPSAALGAAENETMTVHVGLHGLLFEKIAVTPEGNGDVTENITPLVEKPGVSIAVIEDEGLADARATVKLSGEGLDKAKNCGKIAA